MLTCAMSLGSTPSTAKEWEDVERRRKRWKQKATTALASAGVLVSPPMSLPALTFFAANTLTLHLESVGDKFLGYFRGLELMKVFQEAVQGRDQEGSLAALRPLCSPVDHGVLNGKSHILCEREPTSAAPSRHDNPTCELPTR